MASKSLLVLLLLLLLTCSSFSFVEGGSDKKKNDDINDNNINGNSTMDACMTKLSPCQPFVKERSNQKPPIKCCKPLQKLSKTDKKCVCNFINPMNNTISIADRHFLKGCKVKLGCKSKTHHHSVNNNLPPGKPRNGSNRNITPYGITFLGVGAAFAALMA